MAKRKKPTVNAELREKLLKQKQKMGSGVVIKNKTFTKMRLRIMPIENELPGIENISYYCKDMEGVEKDGKKLKGSTSPKSFGMKCPIEAALKELRKGSKEDKDLAKSVNETTEYWMAVLDRDDEGTKASPNIKVLCGKASVYRKVMDFMLDEDDGENITDPVEGRDIRIKKEGQGLDTEWKVNFLDPEPIHEDDAMAEAILEAAESFDVRSHFFKPNWDVLAAMYEYLTGEDMPDWYKDQDEDADADGEGSDDEGGDDDEGTDDDDGGDDDEGGEDDEGEDEGGEIVIGRTRVKFLDEDNNEVEGVIIGEEGDNYLVQGDDDGEDDEPWELEPDGFQITGEVEDEDEEEEDGGDDEGGEEEEEPAVEEKKKPARRKPSRTPAKKTTAKKSSDKKSTASKSSSKKTASKSGSKKAPRKPAGGSRASSKIANRTTKKPTRKK